MRSRKLHNAINKAINLRRPSNEINFKQFARMVRKEGKEMLQTLADDMVSLGAHWKNPDNEYCKRVGEEDEFGHGDRPGLDYVIGFVVADDTKGEYITELDKSKKYGSVRTWALKECGHQPIWVDLIFRISDDDRGSSWDDKKYGLWSVTAHVGGIWGENPLYDWVSEVVDFNPEGTCIFDKNLVKANLKAMREEIEPALRKALLDYSDEIPAEIRFLERPSDSEGKIVVSGSWGARESLRALSSPEVSPLAP